MKTITPCLWFAGDAEQAAQFYCAIFEDSKFGEIIPYGEDSMGEPGAAMTVAFELRGQKFVGLNGPPLFKFSEAVSFQIHCGDQAEVDHFWTKLSAGGEEGPCGWLKDQFGLSWQVVPDRLYELMSDPDPARAKRATDAMMKMSKIDIAKREAAAAG